MSGTIRKISPNALKNRRNLAQINDIEKSRRSPKTPVFRVVVRNDKDFIASPRMSLVDAMFEASLGHGVVLTGFEEAIR